MEERCLAPLRLDSEAKRAARRLQQGDMASTIRLRHPVAHDCLAIACLDRCGGGCSDELTGVIRLWRFEDLTCHSLLDDASSPHDDDPVAQQAHDMQVVTYKQVGHAKS